ncbi:hypothetical protein [Citrobacter sp.]|uniref:hypothetical protein n=1 Tax=Citrobacter sp. TaxID=1896336 RepID=UPI00290A6BF7|nr:hypothetical protein [Citrobacter sp.]MDU5628529.1 hypothetical protein [Citrobacter sp.]
MTKEILAVPGVHPSPLNKRTYKSVQDIDEKLTKLIHRWRFFNAGPPMKVTAYDGTEICYQGVAFKGSPVQVFWCGFIDPYIENYSINLFEQTSALAIECQFPVEESIEEAKWLLLAMIRRIYHEMAETDQILRGDGFNFPEKKDVSGYIESMSQTITEHAKIEKLKKPLTSHNIFNIDTINSQYAQFGTNNNIENQELVILFKDIASSGEGEVIVLSKLFLNSARSKNLLSKETHVILTSILNSHS